MPSIEPIKQTIDQAEKIVVFTGAGISTESGISDYRSKGGLWQRFQPITIQEFLANETKRKEYWLHKKETYAQIRSAKPNEGHLAIARLEKCNRLLGLITQNIDGLHQAAGCQKVVEVHGTNCEVICLDCGLVDHFETAYNRLLEGESILYCTSCSGLLKPNTISFGQSLNPDVLHEAIRLSQSCDLMIAIGSSLVVEPAASFPRYAKNAGAGLIIINRDPTPLDDLADACLHDEIGKTLAALIPAD